MAEREHFFETTAPGSYSGRDRHVRVVISNEFGQVKFEWPGGHEATMDIDAAKRMAVWIRDSK